MHLGVSSMADGGYSVTTLGFDTFVLGVGAQKSGTTWLYDYLNGHPQCDMPSFKEMHFFDLLFFPDLFSFDFKKKDIVARYERIKDKPGAQAQRRAAQFASRIRIADQFEDYLDFFQDMGIDARVSGDITPTYSALDEDQFRRIRDYLTGAGLRVRVVFLMRDPVERTLSQARMKFARANIQMSVDEARRQLIPSIRRPANLARLQYQNTVRNLQSVFEPEELFLEFYENLFQEETVRRLCDFLGIDHVPADFSRNPNPTRMQSFDVSAEDRARIYEVLRPVYDGCREIFGDRVPDSWAKG